MGARERKRHKKIKEYVIARDGFICCYCDLPLSQQDITMEHIVPDSKRGTFNTTNLTVSCYKCNNKRGDKPFFEYCQQYNFSDSKLSKYKKLYFNNLKIKVLNIAKEECMVNDDMVPNHIIDQACKILKIKNIDFSQYIDNCDNISFDSVTNRKKIKFCFEKLIRVIESET